VTDYWY